MILSSDDSDSVLPFLYVSVELSFDDGESLRALGPIVVDFAEKACVVYPSQIFLEYNLMLHFLKPLPQDFDRIDLLKHFIPAYRIHSGSLFTNDRKRPSSSGK